MHLLLLLAAACGDPAGAPCELSPGALGFGFNDDCRGKCLALSNIACSDGHTAREANCSGAEDLRAGRLQRR